MEIVLIENYPSLGYVGDRVSVKPGYARNFLFPRKIAVEVSSRRARTLKHVLAGVDAKRIKLRKEAEEFATRLKQVRLDFTLKIGGGGRSFGAITARDIENALKAQDILVNRKQVRLPEPIKAAGIHQVEIKLHTDVLAPINVSVIADNTRAAKAVDDAAQVDGQAAEAASEGKPARKRGARKGKAAAAEGTSEASVKENASE